VRGLRRVAGESGELELGEQESGERDVILIVVPGARFE